MSSIATTVTTGNGKSGRRSIRSERENQMLSELSTLFRRGLVLSLVPKGASWTKQRSEPVIATGFAHDGRVYTRTGEGGRDSSISMETLLTHYNSPLHEKIEERLHRKATVTVAPKVVKPEEKNGSATFNGGVKTTIYLHSLLKKTWPNLSYSERVDRVERLIAKETADNTIGTITEDTVSLTPEEIAQLRTLLQ